MADADTCPDCEKPANGRWVALAVSLSAGDDAAGSESTARLHVCGSCGQKILGRYVQLATNAQVARARVSR